MAVSKKIVLRFPRRLVERPIIYRLVKDYDLEFNILKASITPEEEGLLVLELKGDQKEYDRGINFLLKTGVKIQSAGLHSFICAGFSPLNESSFFLFFCRHAAKCGAHFRSYNLSPKKSTLTTGPGPAGFEYPPGARNCRSPV